MARRSRGLRRLQLTRARPDGDRIRCGMAAPASPSCRTGRPWLRAIPASGRRGAPSSISAQARRRRRWTAWGRSCSMAGRDPALFGEDRHPSFRRPSRARRRGNRAACRPWQQACRCSRLPRRAGAQRRVGGSLIRTSELPLALSHRVPTPPNIGARVSRHQLAALLGLAGNGGHVSVNSHHHCAEGTGEGDRERRRGGCCGRGARTGRSPVLHRSAVAPETSRAGFSRCSMACSTPRASFVAQAPRPANLILVPILHFSSP